MLIEPIAKDGVQAYITIAVASPESVVEITTACYPQLAVLGERSQIGGVDVLRETALVWQVLSKGGESRKVERYVQSPVQSVTIRTEGHHADGIVEETAVASIHRPVAGIHRFAVCILEWSQSHQTFLGNGVLGVLYRLTLVYERLFGLEDGVARQQPVFTWIVATVERTEMNLLCMNRSTAEDEHEEICYFTFHNESTF